MHPVLYKFSLSGFLGNLFGEHLTIYSYGFFIVMGAVMGVAYLSYRGKKEFNIPFDTVNSLFLLLLLGAFIGGKFFLIFEDPQRYTSNLSELFSGRGFVFYGSLLFCIPIMLWFFRKHKLPVLDMLDIMAIVTVIVHGFGRIGCFMAGCCYGKEYHGPLSVTFSNPESFAKPLNTPLHATQLYSVFMILAIGIALYFIKHRKAFPGQVFLLYLILYGIGRSVVEIFRGDISRGYVIDGVLSHSQLIALIVIGIAVYFYRKLRINAKKEQVANSS